MERLLGNTFRDALAGLRIEFEHLGWQAAAHEEAAILLREGHGKLASASSTGHVATTLFAARSTTVISLASGMVTKIRDPLSSNWKDSRCFGSGMLAINVIFHRVDHRESTLAIAEIHALGFGIEAQVVGIVQSAEWQR